MSVSIYPERENLAVVPVDDATAIEIGDFVYLDSGKAYPASAFAWDTNELTTQVAFKDAFLGVACQAHRAGDTHSIRVRTSGVCRATSSDTANVGDDVALKQDGANTWLSNQVLKKIAAVDARIGKVIERAATASTLLVFFQSEIIHGMILGYGELP